jgi:hypothetical protein
VAARIGDVGEETGDEVECSEGVSLLVVVEQAFALEETDDGHPFAAGVEATAVTRACMCGWRLKWSPNVWTRTKNLQNPCKDSVEEPFSWR